MKKTHDPLAYFHKINDWFSYNDLLRNYIGSKEYDAIINVNPIKQLTVLNHAEVTRDFIQEFIKNSQKK